MTELAGARQYRDCAMHVRALCVGRYRYHVGLLKHQKNRLFERIVERGLQPAEFTIRDSDNDYTYVHHLTTGSFFSLATSDGVFYQGSTRIGEYGPYPYQGGYWTDIVSAFDQWVHNVKLEADTPDMWDEFRKVGEIVAEARQEDSNNTSFTADEQALISAQLKAIKESLREMSSLSSEKLAAVEAALDEADNASRRMGRKDWQILFLGVMFSTIVSALLPADVAQHIIVTLFQGVGHLFSGQVQQQLPLQA